MKKMKKMKKINIDLTILVELKESRMSDKEIAEYLATQEINIAPVTISKILKKYYDSIGKKKPRKPPKPRYTDTINIKKLVDLKESGMSDKEIVEYLRGQGIIRSESTIGTLLRDYYKFMGQEKPRKPSEYRGANPIDINELVKLKEKGMSDKEITEYLATQGINRPEVSIGKIIKKYYDSIGQEKPRKPRDTNPIDINELVKLKEKGMSDKEITEYLLTQGIKRSETTIGKLLRDYYDSIGKYKPIKSRCIGTIDINELVKLKETGMSDREISEYLRGQGIKRCTSLISRYLREYYDSVGMPKPTKWTYVDINELVELKESGMYDWQIAEYLTRKGHKIAVSTVGKHLRNYYKLLGKEKTTKSNAIVNIQELVRLKEEAKMTDEEIAEYLMQKGHMISVVTVGKRLRNYYKLLGKGKPRIQGKKIEGRIDIQELVRLKEEAKMTDEGIAEYLMQKGHKIAAITVGNRLRNYYKLLGKRKPRIKRKKIEERIDIEELARLKEEAEMTDKEISEYLERAGINKSKSAVFQMLREYYQSQGKEKPKIKRNLTIDILTLIRLKEEKGMSDKDIVDYLNENAIEISESSINIRLMQYYNSPEGDRTNIKLGIILNGEKLAKIKESQNMSNKEISEYFQEMGISINSCHIDTTLIQYYTAQGKEVFRKISDNPNKKPIPIKELSSNRYDDDIEEMLMRGMTLKEFILNNRKYQKEDEIRLNLKKLRVVAEYAKKERNIIIPDLNFTTVLDALEESEEKIGAYVKKLMNFMNDGALEEGKLNKAKNMVFLGNVDLMIYIFERLNIKLYPGQDVTLFRNFKNAYRNKIRRYLRTVEQTDANRRQKQQEDNVMEIGDM